MEVEPTGPDKSDVRCQGGWKKLRDSVTGGWGDDRGTLGENQELGGEEAAVRTRRRGRIWGNRLGHVTFQVPVHI